MRDDWVIMLIDWQELPLGYSAPCSVLPTAVTMQENTYLEVFKSQGKPIPGADLERGANHSSGSLKQGVWGAVPPRSYRIFCFMKHRNAA